MGKQQDGFTGGFSGRLGNVVGYNWRGKWCVRSLPADFHDARTERQIVQRKLFAEMVRFAGRAKRILHLSMRVASQNESVTECNYFIKLNKGCFGWENEKMTVDCEALRISDGPVAPVAFDEPQLIDDTTISIEFEKNPLHRNCSQDDLVRLVAYCPAYGDFDFSDGFMRRSKQLVMTLNEAWAGQEVHLYGFVQDRAGRASQSIYIGCGVLDAEAQASYLQEEALSRAFCLQEENALQAIARQNEGLCRQDACATDDASANSQKNADPPGGT